MGHGFVQGFQDWRPAQRVSVRQRRFAIENSSRATPKASQFTCRVRSDRYPRRAGAWRQGDLEVLARQSMNEPSPLAAAGERRLRQLLAGFAIVTAITLAGSFIYLWLYKPAGVHLYFELQRKAALIYIGAWLIVSLLAAICACSSRTLYLSYCLALALCLEGASHLYFYSANRMFYHPFSPLVIHQFDPH